MESLAKYLKITFTGSLPSEGGKDSYLNFLQGMADTALQNHSPDWHSSIQTWSQRLGRDGHTLPS